MADSHDTCTLYQPPLSLWQLIECCTSSHELPEVKRLLGESLVEQSVELHQEVRAVTLRRMMHCLSMLVTLFVNCYS